MKRLLAILAAALIAACAAVPTNVSLVAATKTVQAYVQVMDQALLRGRITPDQAAKASDRAKEARTAIADTHTLLAGCKPPCDPQQILNKLQPTLFELERQMREAQGAKQ